jgi:type I restriction enzyme R subunit
MPAEVVQRWQGDRTRRLREHGIDPADPLWREKLQVRDPKLARSLLKEFWNRWHDELDTCRGACVLRRPELSGIVARSLHHFDGDRYLLLDYVVMPNHAHLLVAFPDEGSMLAQCESWKHYTAAQVNRRLGQRGRFWQQDGFDHLVRSEEQFEYLRDYIAQNPKKAGLLVGEYAHYSKHLEDGRE